MNGYNSGTTTDRINGEKSLMALRAFEIPLPKPIPKGPSKNAVAGIMMISEKNGTNTIWTASGMIFFRPFSTQYNAMAAINGGKT